MSESNTAISREQAHSRARGALFFTGFGAAWVATGLAQAHISSPSDRVSLAVAAVLLLVAISHLMLRSRQLPAAQITAEQRLRTERMFSAVNIIQWVSIATAVTILGLLHMPEYIVPAISVIVGLHLFPLAESFHHRQHYVTGTLLLLWPLLCLVSLPRSRVSGVCALGTGVALLLSAAATLARAFAAMRTVQPGNAVVRG